MSRRKERPPTTPPFPGDTVTLRAGPVVAGGACLSHLEDGRVVLLSYAAPGELVEATIERAHPDYLEAVATAIVEPSPDRVEPACPLFGECGGCQLQHLTYPAQLAAKEAVVREQLRRIGRFTEAEVDAVVQPILGAYYPWGYRNHVRFSTGKQFGDVGFISRRGSGLLKVEHCPIASAWVNDVLPALQGQGAGLHQVQVRHSEATGSWLINPVVAGAPMDTGQKHYVERLAGHDFQVSSSAFFQVNSAQAEQLVRLVGEALPPRGTLLVDAFAGVGTFAVVFAARFEHILAIEESHSAARDAALNLTATPNVELRIGKVEAILPELKLDFDPILAPDAVILDPPRPGCFPAVLQALVRFRAGVVVYVSCNPATLARDLRILVDGGYRLDAVTPVDMFPQTGHIECVARLSLPSSPFVEPA